MASSPPKLFRVTLKGSHIGKTKKIRRLLDSLGLKHRAVITIHKNTPAVAGALRRVKEVVDVKPIVFRTDLENSPNGRELLCDNGHYFISKETLQEIENPKLPEFFQ